MAITQKGFFFQGLSTDAKPTSGISANDRFLEADTRKEYVWSGTAWLLAGAAVDFFDKFRDVIDWPSLEAYGLGGDAGYTIAPEGPHFVIATASTQNNSAWLSDGGWLTILDAGKVITAEFILVQLEQVAAQNIWIEFNVNGTLSETGEHFGWKIINGDLYASNAAGGIQTISDTLVDLAPGGQRTRLKMVFIPGAKILFYVNDVLKITHTTNLPVTSNFRFYAHVQTTSADSVRSLMNLGRVLVEKEHA